MLRRIGPLVLCLISFALALFALETHSLWGDEAFSVWASKQPTQALLGGLDAQPPLYHLLLKAARALWGESVFAIRIVSGMCGVLCVALVWRMARSSVGAAYSSRAAWIAGLFMALSPLAVYYQQEARMYAPALLFALGAMAMTWSGITRPLSLFASVAYASFTLAALFTHFYTFPVLAINSLALLATALHWRRQRVAMLLAHTAIAALFGAWFFGVQWSVLIKPGSGRRALLPPWSEVAANIERGLNGVFFGLRSAPTFGPAAWIALALCLAGGIALWRARLRTNVLLALLWFAFSTVFVFATASKSGIVPDFNARYLLFMVPALALLAMGWARTRPGALAALALIVAASGYGFARHQAPEWRKSRYQEMLARLHARAAPGDVTLLLNSDQFPLLEYYGPLQTPGWMMSNTLWDASQKETLAAQFENAIAGKRRIWLIKYGFASPAGAGGQVEASLNTRATRIYNGEFEDVTLALYAPLAGSTQALKISNIRLGEVIALSGWRLRGDAFRRGESIAMDLVWRADAPVSVDYTVFVHLRNAETGEQIAANDSAPAAGNAPSSGWQPGVPVTDTRGIQIPENTTAGRYRIVLGLYQYPGFERLTVHGPGLAPDATEFVLQEVDIGE
jgi:4-amino-4-deoxy-L-arabinose transferase-like glycosyltransferase